MLRQRMQQRALDALGSTGGKSVDGGGSRRQAGTPMGIAQGMREKAEGREKRRRGRARTAGVVLERFGGERRERKEGKGERGREMVGDPAVGRFKRGMLTLSKGDVVKIQGREYKGKKGGKRRR